MPHENIAPALVHGVVERVLSGGVYDVRFPDSTRVCHLDPILLRKAPIVREGDQVSVIADKDGVFVGEITQIRPRPEPVFTAAAPQPSLITAQTDTLNPRDQRLDRTTHPEWPTAAECNPLTGDEAYCTAGRARVVRVLGKTGNGSRLLELSVAAQPRVSFYAAASNVLIAPRSDEEK
jgi:hypothetical protein